LQMSFHAQCQSVKTDHGQIGMERGLGGAEIDVVFTPDFVQESKRALTVNKGLEVGKAPGISLVEVAAVNNNSASGIAMATKIFCS
jgi:hypothetical protein